MHVDGGIEFHQTEIEGEFDIVRVNPNMFSGGIGSFVAKESCSVQIEFQFQERSGNNSFPFAKRVYKRFHPQGSPLSISIEISHIRFLSFDAGLLIVG